VYYEGLSKGVISSVDNREENCANSARRRTFVGNKSGCVPKAGQLETGIVKEVHKDSVWVSGLSIGECGWEAGKLEQGERVAVKDDKVSLQPVIYWTVEVTVWSSSGLMALLALMMRFPQGGPEDSLNAVVSKKLSD
jgi:hypothetical protein